MERPSEFAYWQSVVLSHVKRRVPVEAYVPEVRERPARVLEAVSAWEGLESILKDIIRRFHLDTNRCLEFGVEYGYSTVALSSLFQSVTGVDTFLGDVHTVSQGDIYAETSAALAPYENIRLVRSDYRDYIKEDESSYDLIHVDIVHTYADTFACGLWSARHSTCTIFHDTESFPTVKQAVMDVARRTRKRFYNFQESNGLGIVV